MSENKFIRHLQGKDTAKSVLEIRNQKTPTSFANMPDGTSNANDVYSDRRGDAAGVLKGTENWKLNNSLLIETSTVYGDGRDFTDDFEVGGSGLWVNATCTFTTARRFAPNTKFVLKLCGHDLDTVAEQTVGFTLIVKFGSTVITKVFSVPVQAFDFCKEFEIDFGESNSSAIKVAANSTMQVQLLCADANAQATIYNGMTVFTALQRRVDSETVSSDTLSLDEIETDLTTHIANKNNPHEVTKAQVGLGNCDNTSDLDKPISTATQTALDGKVSTDGSSIMTGPLKMRASSSFQCAIAPFWDGVGFFKLNSDNSVTLIASIDTPDGFLPWTTNTYNIGSSLKKWKNLYLAGTAYIAKINNGYDIIVPVTEAADSFALESEITDINGKIPAQASTANQLADKNFVNSSIATNTADFKGTYNSLAELEAVTADNNDYGFVVSTDTAGNTVYARYKYNGTSWAFEYNLNNSSFTAAQWATINSGVTASDVSKARSAVQPSDVGNGTITINQGGATKGTFTTNQGGNTIIDLDAGSDGSYHPGLFAHEWDDHIRNDVQWLRADTFSWQDGTVYEEAYQHLMDDGPTSVSVTETIAGTQITYLLAQDGHKLVLSEDENKVIAIYNATGVAWYYIVDPINHRFKLPRVNPAREELIQTIKAKGSGLTLGLVSNAGYTGGLTTRANNNANLDWNGSAYNTSVGSAVYGTGPTVGTIGVTTDADKSGIVSDMTDSTSVFSGKKHLYFYVGNFTQTALENTAGVTTETLNGKADLDLSNITASAMSMLFTAMLPDYSAGVSMAANVTHTATENGWVLFYQFNNADRWFYIDSNQFHLGAGNGGDNYSGNCVMMPISKGQTFMGNDTITFFPCRN